MPESIDLGRCLSIERDVIVVTVRPILSEESVTSWTLYTPFPPRVQWTLTFCVPALVERDAKASKTGVDCESIMTSFKAERTDLRLTAMPCLIASRPLLIASGVIKLNRPSSSVGP